jgi:hypothetical protein
MSNVYDLPEIDVAANTAACIISLPVSPGKAFYPEWVIVPDDVAEQFMIDDVKVGKNSQLGAAPNFPATLFAESAAPDRLACDHIQGDHRLVLQVTNVSDRAARWRGKVAGRHEPLPDNVTPRGVILGFGQTEIPAGSLAQLSVRSQVDMRPRRLHVPRYLLDSVSVEGLYVGPYLDLPQGSKAPLSALTRENLLDRGQVAFEPCDRVGISSFVAVSVMNKTQRPLTFTAALVADMCQ